MKAFLFSFCYNILYTVGWLVTLPSYLLKQKRRGGFGTELLERFGLYRVSYNREPKGVLYVHAVSVGEVVQKPQGNIDEEVVRLCVEMKNIENAKPVEIR